MGNNTELELCLFCGGTAEGCKAIVWVIECCGCGVTMMGNTKSEVTEKWNSRIYNSA